MSASVLPGLVRVAAKWRPRWVVVAASAVSVMPAAVERNLARVWRQAGLWVAISSVAGSDVLPASGEAGDGVGPGRCSPQGSAHSTVPPRSVRAGAIQAAVQAKMTIVARRVTKKSSRADRVGRAGFRDTNAWRFSPQFRGLWSRPPSPTQH